MPRVERTGIYRDERGNALFLRKDRVVGADVLASYKLDESEETLEGMSDAWREIASHDNDAPETVNVRNLAEFGTVGTLPTVNGEVVASSDNVESRETSTVEYPQAIGAETPESPASVKPSRRKSKKNAAADVADDVETPEDDAVESETVAVGEIQAVENKNGEGAFETPESQAVHAGGDADGDGKPDDEEADESESAV